MPVRRHAMSFILKHGVVASGGAVSFRVEFVAGQFSVGRNILSWPSRKPSDILNIGAAILPTAMFSPTLRNAP